MPLEPSFEEQELLAATLARVRSGMTRRDVLAEAIVGAGFVAAVAGLWWLSPPHGFAPAAAIWCTVVMVLATRVRFDTPFGFTVATQLAFVPLLFAAPVAIVPIAVVVALTIARLPDVLRGRVRMAQLLRMPANSWFAIGPAFVFALANVAPREAGPVLLIGALAAQFIGDFGASAVYFGIAREASLRTQLRDSWVYVIDAALSGVALVVAEQIHATPAAVLAMVPLLGLLAMFAHERQQRLGGLLELNETYRGTALLLGDVVAADDGYTGEHSRGVVGLALAVGDQLRLGAEQRRNLEFGALLHDVGKIAIPKEIINKPGKLDPHEWEIIKTHTLEGERMLQRVGGFMREVGQIVRSHHERWDGEGYPDRLAGPAIPLEARIISCCDAWNAMRTDRSYRKALPHATALTQMRANTGSQFDPEVVKAMLRIVAPDVQPADAGPADIRPADIRPADIRPADIRPADTGAATRPAATRPATVRRADVRPAATPAVPAAGARGSERPVVPVADHEPVVVAVEAQHGA
jgi:putative nucleotidyltransferase with HDIG domain